MKDPIIHYEDEEFDVCPHMRCGSSMIIVNGTYIKYSSRCEPDGTKSCTLYDSINSETKSRSVDFLGDIPKKCPHRLVAVDSAMQEIIETNTQDRCRTAAQILIAEIGAEGPENVEDIALRAVGEIGKLRRQHLKDSETLSELNKKIGFLIDIVAISENGFCHESVIGLACTELDDECLRCWQSVVDKEIEGK
jgi:hypothetical protein